MKKILIVNASYYKMISNDLIKGVKRTLFGLNYKKKIIHVSGVFEIPITIRKNIKKYDAFIALGCVIKGKTPHFDLICKSSFDAMMQLSIIYNKPIGNGVITCLNMKQARERSQLKQNSYKPNKGQEASKAIISVLNNEPKKL